MRTFISHIDGEKDSAVPEFVLDLLAVFLVQIAENDVGPLAVKVANHRFAAKSEDIVDGN